MPFKAGDVVVRNNRGFSRKFSVAIESGTVGTICIVVTSGSMYKVRWEGLPICLGVYEDSIRLAPSGTNGPKCEDDCQS